MNTLTVTINSEEYSVNQVVVSHRLSDKATLTLYFPEISLDSIKDMAVNITPETEIIVKRNDVVEETYTNYGFSTLSLNSVRTDAGVLSDTEIMVSLQKNV